MKFNIYGSEKSIYGDIRVMYSVVFQDVFCTATEADAEGWQNQWRRAFSKYLGPFNNTNTLLH